MTLLRIAAAASALLALAACGQSTGTPSTTTTTPSSAPSRAASSPSAAPSPQASPMTAAAAQAAATAYFDFYAAGQYAAVYPLLSPAARQVISQSVWMAVHEACRSTTAGLSYKVSRPELAGTTAVVNVSLAGAAAAIGSEEETFTYSGGRWLYAPTDLSIYRHHTAAQAVEAAKAQDLCS
jgi:hypothetical protein